MQLIENRGWTAYAAILESEASAIAAARRVAFALLHEDSAAA
jgi:hypothetical protein